MKTETKKEYAVPFKAIRRTKNIVFFTVLGVFAVIGLMWFWRPTVSETEKRELTPFPELTFSGLMDGSFADGVSKWYSDTYPLREWFIGGAHALQSLYGDRSEQIIIHDPPPDDVPPAPSAEPTQPASRPSSVPGAATSTTPSSSATEAPTTTTSRDGTVTTPGEVLGSIYVTGDSGYSLYYFSQGVVDQYADFVNRSHRALGEGVNVYSMPIPLSSGVMLDPSLLEAVGASDQKAAIAYIDSRMEPGVHGLDLFDTLKEHNAEYLYFRTDHHWTALGAYYAYTVFCREKGVTPHGLERFEQKSYPGFLGTFYAESLSQAMKANPDTLTAYIPMGTNEMTFTDKSGNQIPWSIVMDATDYSSSGKYNCFAGSDQPYAVAHNPKITDGSACVVVKDSFGNAFVPFLVDHYEYVYWIDFRYYKGTLTDLVKEKNIGDVIYCLNLYNTTTSSAIGLLNGLVP